MHRITIKVSDTAVEECRAAVVANLTGKIEIGPEVYDILIEILAACPAIQKAPRK